MGSWSLVTEEAGRDASTWKAQIPRHRKVVTGLHEREGGGVDVAGGLDDQGSRSCNVRDEMIGDIRASRRVDVYTGIGGR